MRDYRLGMYLLTVVCGLIDGTCLLALGGVFAQLMTGNLLFLGLSIGSAGAASPERIVAYLLVIIPFCIGAVIAGRLVRRLSADRSRRTGYLIEWVLVLLGALVALILAPNYSSDPLAVLRGVEGAQGHMVDNLIIVAILALAMGIHAALTKQHGLPNIATNVMTMTLTTTFSDGPLAGSRSSGWQRRALSIVIFVASAALAAVLIRFGVAVPLLVAAGLFGVALFSLIPGPETEAV